MLFSNEMSFSVALVALLCRGLGQREEGSMAQAPVSGVLGDDDSGAPGFPPLALVE